MLQIFQTINKYKNILLFFLLIPSTAFTYMGMTGDNASSDGWSSLRPVLMCLVSFVVVYSGFWFFTSIITIAKSEDMRKLKIAIVLFCILVVSTSSYYGSVGIAGHAAIAELLNRFSENFADSFNQLVRQKREEETLLPVVKNGKNVFLSVVRREEDAGLISGLSGKGKVSENIKGMVDAYENLEKMLEEYFETNRALTTKGYRQLEEFRMILADKTITINEKSERFANLHEKFNQTVLDLEYSILPTFTAEVESMDSTYLLTTDDRSRQILAVLRKPISNSKTMILEAVAGLHTQPVAKPKFKMVGALEAVLLTPAYSYPSLIYALATDLIFPASLLLALYFLSSRIRNSNINSGASSKARRKVEYLDIVPPVSYAMKAKGGSNTSNTTMHANADKDAGHDNGNGDSNGRDKTNGGNGKHLDPPAEF